MAISGLLAPVVFVSLSGTATFITPGYDLFRETVSQMASPGRPYWWLANASIVLYCLLVQPLGPLLYAAAPSRLGGTVLWLLIVQYGAGGSLAAVFRTGDRQVVWGGFTAHELHYAAAQMGFLAILTLCFVAPLVLRGQPEWRAWRTYSLVLGVLTLLFLVPFYFNLVPEWRGALQRGFFATTLLWVFGTSVRFWLMARRATQDAEA